MVPPSTAQVTAVSAHDARLYPGGLRTVDRIMVRTLAAALVIAACAGSCSGSDSITPAEFYDEAWRARACSPGDRCSFFLSARPCLCSMGVRTSELDRIEALAGRVECGDVGAFCTEEWPDQRCVAGACVGIWADLDAGLADGGPG
jgi:hypothetical protein